MRTFSVWQMELQVVAECGCKATMSASRHNFLTRFRKLDTKVFLTSTIELPPPEILLRRPFFVSLDFSYKNWVLLERVST